MLNTIAKRIQSRLSRQGVKVSLPEIKTQCELMIADIENPTETELLGIQNQFMSNANQLSISSLDNNIDDLSISNLDSNTDDLSISSLDDIAIAPQTEPAPLVVSPKNELVASTADQMGIVLDASEISMIAENISISSDDFDQDIDAIKSAIMAFIQHKSMVNQSKINQMIHEVREVVTEKNSENSQLLADGLRSINQDIQEANKQFKSSVRSCLSAFDIPALKAS
jgi:hypothetical protein